MESISICSRKKLSSLHRMVEERMQHQAIAFLKTSDGCKKISIDMEYLDEFCNIFSGWLHSEIKDKIIEAVMKESFVFSSAEKHNVYRLAANFIEENNVLFTNIIYEKAFIMLSSHKTINLEGFTNFSIREYKNKIEEIIESSFEQYLIEKEYLEFINLMRCYIEVEECRFGRLNVVTNTNGRYSFFDENFQDITNQCMQEFISEFENELPEPDDCLITILILLLPEEIRIYGINHIKNERILKTLEKLFENRIKFFSKIDQMLHKKL